MPKTSNEVVVPSHDHPGHLALAQAQATPAHAPDQPLNYTPPPIPKPLPPPGGPIVPVVGAAPARPAPSANVESPASGGTPGAAGTAAVQYPATNPGAPPQPAATPIPSGAGTAATPTPSATVTMTPDFKFDPANVTIQRGQAVRWTNKGRAPQTVTADPVLARDKSHAALPGGAKPFNSGVVNAGVSYTHAFDVPGTYSYFSIPQEDAGMLGTVTVQ